MALFTHQTPRLAHARCFVRNDDVGLGAWAAKEVRGRVTLILQYAAFAAGVDVNSFQTIITAMLREVAEVEATLHRRGLL